MSVTRNLYKKLRLTYVFCFGTLTFLLFGFQSCGDFKGFDDSLKSDKAQIFEAASLYNSGDEATLVLEAPLADPNVLYEPNIKEFFLTGTSPSNTIRIYKSKTGTEFSTIFKNINPSQIDSQYNYCYIWAPDISKNENGNIRISFSAARYNKGQACPDIRYVTTFYIDFDSPDLLNPSSVTLFDLGAAKSRTVPGCRIEGCERTVRIDSNLFNDPIERTKHFFYTWFSGGNNISSISYDQPNWVTRRAQPLRPSDESIAEAPDVFKRGKYYYMILSTGHFKNSYGLEYYFSENLNNLGQGERYTLRQPEFADNNTRCEGYSGKRVVDAGGHSSTVRVGPDYFIYYHINNYIYDSNGCHGSLSRFTHRSPLHFLADGKIRPLKTKMVTWNSFGDNYVYSLDVRFKNGESAMACKNASDLSSKNQILLEGSCRNGLALQYDAIQDLRICTSNNNWKSAYCSPYRVVTNALTELSILSSRKNITWNRIDSNHIYSIDVRLKSGETIAPCINAGIVGKSDEFTITGSCSGKPVVLNDIAAVRVCATKGSWNSAICTPYTNAVNKSKINLWFEAGHSF